MTTFPGSPRLLRGAIVAYDSGNPVASVIPFQYNPEKITRSLSPRTRSLGLGKKEALAQIGSAESRLLTGPPKESISLKIELDATDPLEKADALAIGMGIHPQLAALEMLLYPKTRAILANGVLSKVGTLEIKPIEAPLTLLVWGVKRVVPVQLESLSIDEEAYDVNLNPIRATVSLSMQVLSYVDLKLFSKGGALFMAHQVIKEGLAVLGSASNGASAGSKILPL